MSKQSISAYTASIAAMCVTSLATLAAPSAVFAADGFDIQQFQPMPNLKQNYFGTSSAEVAPHMHWSAFMLMNYANNPLVLLNDADERVDSVIASQATLHLLGSLSLFNLLEIGLDLPLIVYQDGGSTLPTLNLAEAGFGVGDLRLVPKIQIFTTRTSPYSSGIALAAMADLHLPTGNGDSLQGGDFRIGPRFAFEGILEGGFRFAANLGYQYRPETQLQNLSVDDTFGWSIAAELPVTENLAITSELFGRISPAGGIQREESPMELMLGAKGFTGPAYLVGGGSMGLINGYGTPDWRLFFGFGIATPTPAPIVEAPPEPEPDCRPSNVAETCPEVPPAACTDGVLRVYAASCPQDACEYPATEVVCATGTICGQENDAPACVPEPQCTVATECTDVPGPSCQDNVLSTFAPSCQSQQCVYERNERACDTDYACGLAQGVAACVLEPKEQVARIDIEKSRIEITEMVFFETNSAAIEQRSLPLLNQVARLLRENAQLERIRIEGHTDNRGSSKLNTDLSQRRAESVRDYLISQGVAAERLTAQGFGPQRPVEDNKTEKGRAANRRVEFHIVE